MAEQSTTPTSMEESYQKIGFRFTLIFFSLFIIFLDWSANPLFSHLYYYGNLAVALDNIIGWVGNDLFTISSS
jgi:hypothetical protein